MRQLQTPILACASVPAPCWASDTSGRYEVPGGTSPTCSNTVEQARCNTIQAAAMKCLEGQAQPRRACRNSCEDALWLQHCNIGESFLMHGIQVFLLQGHLDNLSD
eukprot:358490-Chlamydomonas_euryale.AAC.5